MNALLGELAAAIGLIQLRKLEGFIEKRRALACLYREQLAGVAGVELPPWHDAESNGSLFPVRLLRRAKAIDALAREGIETAIHYRPVHLHTAWANGSTDRRGSHPHAEVLGEWTLSLPLHPRMEAADVERVAAVVRRTHAR